MKQNLAIDSLQDKGEKALMSQSSQRAYYNYITKKMFTTSTQDTKSWVMFKCITQKKKTTHERFPSKCLK